MLLISPSKKLANGYDKRGQGTSCKSFAYWECEGFLARVCRKVVGKNKRRCAY